MASYNHQQQQQQQQHFHQSRTPIPISQPHQAHPQQPLSFINEPPAFAANPATVVPPGTLPPGSKVRVGKYSVTIVKFLSEGGFAHVYLATSETPINGTTKHVLKRMAVPDKKGVEEVGHEVEVMRQLRSHPKIVHFIEASVSELKSSNGLSGYEIFILMEWCAGGGIIDMMNTRLQNRLTETEILKIFSDTVEAVAHMHYQDPPLIHRDLKVENILLTPPSTYKLCDFGSTTTPLPPSKVPTLAAALQALEQEINRTTTLQYRAPELVDVWGRKGFDEKIDIWALGVFLYKLCYYTTPFEEHGPLAIMNAQYKIPPYPAYSNSIKGLIATMLQERAAARPNIYQVHEMVCRLRGSSIKLENKYATTSSSSRPSSSLSPSLPTQPIPSQPQTFNSILSSHSSSAPSIYTPSPSELATQISPMRRGRPTKPTTASNSPAASTDHLSMDPRMARTGTVQGTGAWNSGGGNGGTSTSPAPTTTASGSPAFDNNFTASFATKFGADDGSPIPSPAIPSPPPVTTVGSGEEEVINVAEKAALFSDLVVPGFNNTGGLSNGGGSGRGNNKTGGSAGYEGLGAGSSLVLPSAFCTGVEEPRVKSVLTGETPSTSTSNSKKEEVSSEAGPPLPRRPPGGSSLSSSSTTTSPTTRSWSGSGGRGPAKLSAVLPPVASSSSSHPSSSSSAHITVGTSTSKPEFISRSSQTSPRLLATSMGGISGGGYGSGGSQNWRAALTSSSSSSSVGEGSTIPTTSSPLNPGSVTSPPPPPPLSTTVHVPSSTTTTQKDLLGDDDDEIVRIPIITSRVESGAGAGGGLNVASKRLSMLSYGSGSGDSGRENFRPVRPSEGGGGPGTSYSPSATSTSSWKAKEKEKEKKKVDEDVENRFPALEDFDLPPKSNGGEKEKREEGWQSIVEKEDESSDDDEKDFTPRPSSIQPPPSSQLSQSQQQQQRFTGHHGTSLPLHLSSPAPISQPSTTSLPTLPTPPPPAPKILSSPTSAAPTSIPDSLDDFVPNLPKIQRADSFSSDEEDHDSRVDLGPALASIRKFAPAGNDNYVPPPPSSTTKVPPKILAPKPQTAKVQTALSSLVNRYETLSTTADVNGKVLVGDNTGASSTSSTGVGVGVGGKRGGPPPIAAPKPTTLRGRGNSVDTGSPTSPGGSGSRTRGSIPHWSSPSASVDNFQSRFPNEEGLEAHLASPPPPPSSTTSFSSPPPPPSMTQTRPLPATPPATSSSFPARGERLPFKPVPPPTSPITSNNRGGVRDSPSNSQSQSQVAKGEEEEEGEEKFAGVSNMRSRWEGMGKSNNTGAGGSSGGGLVKPVARKTWGVV